MKNNLNQLKKYLSSLLIFVIKHSALLFLLIFACLAGYLVVRIGYLSRLEPTQAQIDQKISEIKRTTNDTESVQKLKELEGRNISIEALFDNGRTNPFEN